jgi:ABC-2 type transport system permease protein
MQKTFAIIRREYLTRVKSRGFVIWTILTPLLATALMLGPGLFASRFSSKTKLVFIDPSGDSELFVRVTAELNDGQLFAGRFETRLEIPSATMSVEALKQSFSAQLKADKVDGYVVVPANVTAPGSKLEVHTAGLAGNLWQGRVRNAFNRIALERRLVQQGIAAERLKAVTQPLETVTINERDQEEGTNAQAAQAYFLSFGLLFVFYMLMIFYGTFVMRGVIEEKQSRIIEVLLSSIRPVELMLGKLIGVGLVSLTQVTIWLTTIGLLSATAALPLFALAGKVPGLKISTIFFFLLYFTLGYFLYSTLYLIIGALVSAEEDAQSLQVPVIASIVIPVMMLFSVLRQPNSTTSVTLSLIPIFSPILMFARTIVQTPPWWQIALSVVLLLLTIFGAVWLAAKIYRVGVLMYGKPPTLPELWRWMKYS